MVIYWLMVSHQNSFLLNKFPSVYWHQIQQFKDETAENMKRVSKQLKKIWPTPTNDYAISGAVLLRHHSGRAPGRASVIEDQYDLARREMPSIDTVIMNGGGNDVRVNDDAAW